MTGGDMDVTPGRTTDAFRRSAQASRAAPGAKAAPFSLRLTADERELLERRAGRQSLGAYIRERLLCDAQNPRRDYRKPVRDERALAEVLAALGNARLSSNLNQLAKAAHTGSLPVTPETEKAIQTACSDVSEMRRALVAALGLGPGGPS